LDLEALNGSTLINGHNHPRRDGAVQWWRRWSSPDWTGKNATAQSTIPASPVGRF